jgi:catechol 2,3-dioxygenase-like lactoylglutathione lyase family enzyme
VFDHVTIRVSDREIAQRFYVTVLGTLAARLTNDEEGCAEWGDFSLVASDAAHPVTQGLHVGFTARARAEVDAFWRAGTEAGARDDGPPGPRPQYREDYYGGFLLDPDGNSVEAVHHGATRDDGIIDHLWLRVSDVAASAAFYATVARAAGHQLVEHSPAHVQVKGATGSFSLVGGTPTRNVHIAFPADDDATVEAFHAVATGAGHPSNGAPAERPEYHAGYYAAFVLDPDGNNIELVNHNR